MQSTNAPCCYVHLLLIRSPPLFGLLVNPLPQPPTSRNPAHYESLVERQATAKARMDIFTLPIDAAEMSTYSPPSSPKLPLSAFSSKSPSSPTTSSSRLSLRPSATTSLTRWSTWAPKHMRCSSRRARAARMDTSTWSTWALSTSASVARASVAAPRRLRRTLPPPRLSSCGDL